MDNNFKGFFEKNYRDLSGLSVGRPLFKDIEDQYTVNIPINTLTRHGLVTGSTGTGKSRIIQLMIEKLYEQGVPVFLSDIKGDMCAFAKEGGSPKASERAAKLAYEIIPKKYETNYWGSLPGFINFKVKLSEIDFVILAKLLELNPTQESHLGVIYKFASDKNIDIRNLKDLKDIVTYLMKYPNESIGSSTASLGVIHRKITTLEFSNIDAFFGLPEFDIQDFFTKGINILWLQNYQKERFNAGNLMAFVLYRLYSELPEVGEGEKPKLVIFIDEAHQIFANANSSLVDLMVTILKQIRSKGVGIIFNTQNADDIPEKILEQLGLKVQFALRAFSQKELLDIKGAMESFPKTELYDLKEEIKSLDTGMAFISVINPAGALLPPVKTAVFPPASSMEAISSQEISDLNNKKLVGKYNIKITDVPLDLGSNLDNITIPSAGKWHIEQYIEKKEDQKLNREVGKKNRNLRKFLYIIAAILALIAIIYFLFLMSKVLNKVG
jgi:hypothetical protein